jgi:hypothetical protein
MLIRLTKMLQPSHVLHRCTVLMYTVTIVLAIRPIQRVAPNTTTLT